MSCRIMMQRTYPKPDKHLNSRYFFLGMENILQYQHSAFMEADGCCFSRTMLHPIIEEARGSTAGAVESPKHPAARTEKHIRNLLITVGIGIGIAVSVGIGITVGVGAGVCIGGSTDVDSGRSIGGGIGWAILVMIPRAVVVGMVVHTFQRVSQVRNEIEHVCPTRSATLLCGLLRRERLLHWSLAGTLIGRRRAIEAMRSLTSLMKSSTSPETKTRWGSMCTARSWLGSSLRDSSSPSVSSSPRRWRGP